MSISKFHSKHSSARWAVGLAIFLCTACSRNEPLPASPIAPTVPAAPIVPMFVLSGLVSDGGRPVDNARVDVLAMQRIAERTTAWWPAGRATTDASGRYRILVVVVFEATPTGRQPVESAGVVWEDSYDGWFNAETRADAAGRYLLCGLPRSRISGLWAFKQGYMGDPVSVEAGSDAVVDIEMRRR